MVPIAGTEEDLSKAAQAWRSPGAWLRAKNLSQGYWVFFSAAFFFDAGFSIYVFLFNLFLYDHHLNERAIGWIGGAMTLGSVAGTLPAGALLRKLGIRPLLIALFLAAPALNAGRVIWLWVPAQVTLAFVAGLAMSAWGVCFLPAIARLTTDENRTAGYSLIFSAGVGSSMLGGIICGYLKQWLQTMGVLFDTVTIEQMILLFSCCTALAGIVPALRLKMPASSKTDLKSPHPGSWWRVPLGSPFLLRFLPLMALWCGLLSAFTPFANIYLSRDLRVPLEKIGVIFSAVQVLQFSMGFVIPIVCMGFGLIRGICLTQLAAAGVLAGLALTRNTGWGIALYLIFCAAQWMSSPALYNLLMTETPEADRSHAAAATLFCNAVLGSAATAISGTLFAHFGYPPVLGGLAVFALGVTVLLYLFMSPYNRKGLAHPRILH